MNILDRWHLRAVTKIFKEKSGKPFGRSDQDFLGSKKIEDQEKLDGYATLPLVKPSVNLVALMTQGQGFSINSDTLQENNDALLKTTVNAFTMSDRQLSLTTKVDILIEYDPTKGTTVLKPLPLSHVKARPDHLNDSYVLEWESETKIVSDNGEVIEDTKTIRQVYNTKEITTYIEGVIEPEYSYPNTLGIQRIVTINIQDLPGRDDPMIGKLEYNIATLYKQALNALGVVVKLTGEPDKYATGAITVPKESITNLAKDDGDGNIITVPQFVFTEPNATYGWTEPPKGIPDTLSFLEILFLLFIEQTGIPEGMLTSVTGMNSTSNQLQVFIRTIIARQNAQTEGIKEVMCVLEAVNNLNSLDKVDLLGDIEWPEAFPDTETIKEIVIALIQDTTLSDESKIEMIKQKYLEDLPEWKTESKRKQEQKKLEFEAEVNAHHEDSDTITDGDE